MLKNTKNLGEIITKKGPESNPAQPQEMPVFTASFLATEEGQTALKQLVRLAREGLLSPVILGQKLSEISEALPQLIKIAALLKCEELISITDAAEFLGISRQTLYRHFKGGDLPSSLFKFRNNLLKVRKSELIKILGEGKINGCL